MSLPIPNFLIMGAQKSGTTSLHEYLRQHPEIFMSSPVKEPGYFLGEQTALAFWQRRGRKMDSLDELLSQHMLRGYRGQTHFGESSTYYTIGRRSLLAGIPQRIAQVQPGMKFLYILRDPLDRIQSNYLHSLRNGTNANTLDEYLAGRAGRSAELTSLYFQQIQAYLDHFPADRFHVVIFEEFLESPDAHMDAICRFLGVGPMPQGVKYAAHNVAGNREQSADGDRMAFSPVRLAALKESLGEDARKLCVWLGRDGIPAWSTLRG